MATKEFSKKLYDAVENYYQFNPDTLMPLLMVALAANGKLNIVTGIHKPNISACILEPSVIKDFDWVTLNQSLKRKVGRWVNDGVNYVSVEMEIGRSLLSVFKIFKRNDEKDVVQEYHHRKGRLVLHSGNVASEKAHRQYATFVLAEALLNAPKEFLREKYLFIFNHMLVKSGLQPKRPRLKVARALTTLLKYDGYGLVYNPFAGCSIAGAMLQSKENYYGDGDTNDKLYAAGLLLNYGMGVSNEHFLQRDSTQWLTNKKIDYLISTYIGYIDGKSAFEFCLEQCLNDPIFTGKYAGVIQPKELFEKEMHAFKEALKRDWVDTIVLLPFGEVAILINSSKEDSRKKTIRFINGTNPLSIKTSIETLIDDNKFAIVIKNSDAKKKGYLKSLIVTDLPERDGYKKVRLGDFVKKIPRKVYNLEKFTEEERVLAFINRAETYYGFGWDENIGRKPVFNLFGPVYQLVGDSLIVNKTGVAEPRIFDSNKGCAFFEDGFAFSLREFVDPEWIVKELAETYVRKQLHPYGINKMVPEVLTEDDYLNLILYIETEEEISDKPESTDVREAGIDALETGYTLIDGNKRYTILNFIAQGAFGYTYRAEMLNCNTGTKEIVAIKEYYPTGVLPCKRDNNRVIIDEEYASDFYRYRDMFRSEPDLILSMSDVDENHVTEVKSIFECEPTGTIYYVMKYYSAESLRDMIIAGQIPSSEQLIIEKIVIPLCKALKAMHSHNILHLDIKPDNIVIDENGEAVLIDFGVAQLYDDEGRLVSIRDIHSSGPFSPPENKEGNMRYFGPQADIYGAAATLFTMMSQQWPHPIEGEIDKHCVFDVMDGSDKMKAAIAEGLYKYTNDRPANAQLFLRNFPGCEDIKL